MTVTYQLSDRRGEAILLVKSEHDSPDVAYSNFGAAVQDAGLEGSLGQFGQGLVQAQTVAAAALGARPASDPWAAPAPAAPAYPAQPAPGAPACHHGQMTRRTGTNSRGAWTGYFCPSPKGTPDQCKARFE